MQIHRYVEVNNKYTENYDKNKNSSCIQYLDANNLYGWAMSQKLPDNEFKWIKDILSRDKKLNKFMNLIENYDEDNDKGYVMVSCSRFIWVTSSSDYRRV